MKDTNAKLLSTPKLFTRENDIIQWGIDRNIIGNTAQGTVAGQLEKTRQEHQEWKDKHSKDDLGDIFVTLVMASALKGSTISGVVNETLYDFYSFIERNHELLHMFCKDRLDSDVKDLLKVPYNFNINVVHVVVDLYMVAIKYGWTLDECIEVAWLDIKDRTGLMVHGTFIKQQNLDTLFSEGMEVKTEDNKVWLEGKVDNPEVVYNVLDELGFEYQSINGLVKTFDVKSVNPDEKSNPVLTALCNELMK